MKYAGFELAQEAVAVLVAPAIEQPVAGGSAKGIRADWPIADGIANAKREWIGLRRLHRGPPPLLPFCGGVRANSGGM